MKKVTSEYRRRVPKLRTADKVPPPYALAQFRQGFPEAIGKEVIYLLATQPVPTIEGEQWERIFAKAIGAEWKPSNVGLDDVVLGNCAWGVKSVKSSKPFTQKRVRLISGRNSPVFSFGTDLSSSADPNEVGQAVLDIWNARVESVRAKHAHVRTLVVIKSNDLSQLCIFEMETLRYDPEIVQWSWNKNNNLEGRVAGSHYFTWQPHGSQFTIIQDVPEVKLCLQIRKPPSLADNQEAVLGALGYDRSWITVVSPDN